MAVELKIAGRGAFAGLTTNLTGYSATEDATPTDANTASGGVGQLSFEAVDAPEDGDDLMLLMDSAVELHHSQRRHSQHLG